MNRRFRQGAPHGIGLFLVFMFVLILIPILMIFVRNAMYQNRATTIDKNLKAARDVATAAPMDYVRSFAEDYFRDKYAPIILSRNNPNFAGFGSSQSSVIPDRDRKTIRVISRGTYSKHGRVDGAGIFQVRDAFRTSKTVEGLIHFRNDLTRFGHYWDANVSAMNWGFPETAVLPFNFNGLEGSLFVNGSLNLQFANVTFRQGVIVVTGTFTADGGTTLNNVNVYCQRFIPTGPVNLLGGSQIIDLPDPAIGEPIQPVPELWVHNPMGRGGDDRTGRFRYQINPSTRIWAIEDVELDFGNPDDDSVTISTPTAGSWVYTLPPSTAPATLTVFAASTATIRGTITRRLTVVVLSSATGSGGHATVLDNFRYGGASPDVATSTASFALFAHNKLTFLKSGGGPHRVSGFYYTRNGPLEIRRTGGGGAANLEVSGSVFGVLINFSDGGGQTLNRFTVTPDRDLYMHSPPYFPERAYVATWDYTP